MKINLIEELFREDDGSLKVSLKYLFPRLRNLYYSWSYENKFNPLVHPFWVLQRGRRGYANVDIWSFDSYLFEVLSKALLEFKNAHCHPCMYEGPEEDYKPWDGTCNKCGCSERWNNECTHIADLCKKLKEDDYFCTCFPDGACLNIDHINAEYAQQERDYQEVMAWLTKRMGHLWT